MNKEMAYRWMLTGLMIVAAVGLAHASALGGGTASDIDTFFTSTSSFVIKTIGFGVFVIGLAMAGIKMSAKGDSHEGLQTAIAVIIGGVLTFLAPTIANVLKGFAGN